MPILAGGQRRYLFDKALTYLFSYDLALEQAPLMPTTGGVGFTLGLDRQGPREEHFEPQLVYHVLDEQRVENNDAITGTVEWFSDQAFVPYDERVGSVQGSIVIRTEDNALIDSRYTGSLSLGALRLWHFDPPDGAGERRPRTSRAKVFITPRFETSYPKYRWLTERQCAAFGWWTSPTAASAAPPSMCTR
jgi:hypothetical protein